MCGCTEDKKVLITDYFLQGKAVVRVGHRVGSDAGHNLLIDHSFYSWIDDHFHIC